jgi:hypothetical protein
MSITTMPRSRNRDQDRLASGPDLRMKLRPDPGTNLRRRGVVW